MGSRKRRHDRCKICCMRHELCLCDEAQICRTELSKVSTFLTLITHYKELRRTTNSGRLAHLALPNSEILMRGDQKNISLGTVCKKGYDSLLLFPHEDALYLEDYVLQNEGPFQLIVPDGNWRQATKIAKREKALMGLPRVRFRSSKSTQYQLRRETREGGMATFEAIAQAMGLIEGSFVEQRLIALFHQMVARTLKSRNGIVLSI